MAKDSHTTLVSRSTPSAGSSLLSAAAAWPRGALAISSSAVVIRSPTSSPFSSQTQPVALMNLQSPTLQLSGRAAPPGCQETRPCATSSWASSAPSRESSIDRDNESYVLYALIPSTSEKITRSLFCLRGQTCIKLIPDQRTSSPPHP